MLGDERENVREQAVRQILAIRNDKTIHSSREKSQNEIKKKKEEDDDTEITVVKIDNTQEIKEIRTDGNPLLLQNFSDFNYLSSKTKRTDVYDGRAGGPGSQSAP